MRGLDSLLGIESSERRLVGLLFMQYFCTGIASVFTQTAAFSLFLARFDATDLPYTYLVMAVALSALTFSYLQAGRYLAFGGQLRLNLAAQMLFTLAFAAGLTLTGADWIVFLLPVLFQIAVVYGNMTFWSLAGRILDVRQGRRLFGLVGSGEWLAIVIMGFLMPVIVPVIGLDKLLWVAVLGVVGALLFLNVTLRVYPDRLQESPHAAVEHSLHSAPPLLGNSYVVTLLALTLVWWVGFFFVDNIFYDQSAQQFPQSEDLAGFLGIYLGVVGILTLLTNSLLAGRLIGALGLRASLLILPLGLLGGALAMAAGLLFGGPLALLFVAAVVTRVWGIWIGFSVDQSARSILYQPLTASLRTRTQMTADGIVQPLAIGTAGLAMLALGALYPEASPPLILATLVLSAALLVIVVLAGRAYGRALLEALDRRRLRPTGIVLDRTSVDLVRQSLASPHPGAVVYAMRMLEGGNPDALMAEVPRLLRHPSPQVRRHALAHIGSRGLTTFAAEVGSMLAAEPVPEIRGEAVRALGLLGDQATPIANLQSAELPVRSGAITGLLSAPAPGSSERALAALEQLTASADPIERREAARTLGALDPETLHVVPLLRPLLDDSDQEVRRAAIRAAGHLGDASLLPRVIAQLGARATRSAARWALTASGERALAPIAAALARPSDTSSTALLLGTLGFIGTPRAEQLLLPFADSAVTLVRDASVRALAACNYRAVTPPEIARVHGWVGSEAAHGLWLCRFLVDLDAVSAAELVRHALREHLRACRNRLLTLVSFLADAPALLKALETLDSPEQRRRAYALEVIDIQVPRSLKPLVLPFTGPLEAAAILARSGNTAGGEAGSAEHRLRELARDDTGRISAFTRAAASHALVAGEPVPRDHSPEQEMVELVEKVLMLRTVGIFDATSDEALAEVAAVADLVDAAAGSSIIAEGAAGDSMYVVASGQVRVHQGSKTLNMLAPGEVFGEMALLDPEPRSASVTATEDTRLLCLDQQALFELIDAHPEVARGMLQVLTRRLRQAIDRAPQPT